MADAWLGSEIGLLKGVDLTNGSFVNHGNLESAEKSKEICVMCWANKEETEICVGLRDRIVRTFCTESYSFGAEKKITDGEGNFVGLFKQDSLMVTCVESGNLQMWKGDRKLVDVQVGNSISRMRNNPHQTNQVGTGGRENDLKIWDLNAPGEAIFKAKNVRNDMLDLRVPVWISDFGFVSQSNSLPVVAVGTKYHQIRLYDTKAQKRPVLDVEFQDSPITTLVVSPNNNNILVGNSIGTMAALDLRTGKPLGFYKGAAGSIRCIACSGEYVASCGLDRFVRVHNLDTRQLVKKVYLKSRLNTVLLPSESSRRQWQVEGEKERVEDKVEKRILETAENKLSDEEADELWNQMDVVTTEKPVKKKRKKKLKE